MKGKNKCKILKEIRQRIADENEIPYVTRECTYQGECRGTCPKCEAELRYLERELEKRRSLGKTVAVAAVAASLSLGISGCVSLGSRSYGSKPSGAVGTVSTERHTEPSETFQPLEGEPVETVAGEIDTLPPETTETELEPELEGDVVFLPETEDRR